MITRGSGEFDATVTLDDGEEVDVTVKYRGYSDPGKLYGPPENCYPPEGEMELEIIGAEGKNIPPDELDRIEEMAYEVMAQDDRERREDMAYQRWKDRDL